MTSLEEILVKLGLDATGFEKGLRTAHEKAKDWAKETVKVLSAPLVAIGTAEGLKEVYEQLVEFADKTVDLSHRLGISTDAIQAWDYALKKNGSSVESAAGFFEKLAVNRDKALGGGAEGAKVVASFQALGVSIDDLKKKRIEDIAEQIGEIFHAGGDPQKLIGALREVGGKGAGDMMATFRDGFKESKEELEGMGGILGNTVLHELKEAGEAAKKLGIELRGALAPLLELGMGIGQSIIDSIRIAIPILSELFKGLAGQGAGKFGLPDFEKSGAAAKAAAEIFKIQGEHNAAEDKRKRQDAVGKGGAYGGLSEEEKEKIKRINDEAAKMEDKAQSKTLTVTEQIAKLHIRRNELMDDFNDKSKTELERAEARKALAENALEINTKTKEQDKTRSEILDQIAEKQQRISHFERDKHEDLMSPSYSTVQELAQSHYWRGTAGVYARTARRVEFLEHDSKIANQLGNTGVRDWDLREAKGMRDWLEKSGVIKPDHHLENIDENISKLREEIIKDGVKLQDD